MPTQRSGRERVRQVTQSTAGCCSAYADMDTNIGTDPRRDKRSGLGSDPVQDNEGGLCIRFPELGLLARSWLSTFTDWVDGRLGMNGECGDLAESLSNVLSTPEFAAWMERKGLTEAKVVDIYNQGQRTLEGQKKDLFFYVHPDERVTFGAYIRGVFAPGLLGWTKGLSEKDLPI